MNSLPTSTSTFGSAAPASSLFGSLPRAPSIFGSAAPASSQFGTTFGSIDFSTKPNTFSFGGGASKGI